MGSAASADAGWLQRSLGPRIRFFQTNGEKFKSCSLRVYFHTPLAEETCSATALVPHVLGRGCRGYADMAAVHRRLEELYGAAVGAGAVKLGEVQSLYLGLDVVQGRYLPEDVLPAAADLLSRMCLQPTVDGEGHFPAETVRQEKDNLARRIQSLINDKHRYAAARCVEEMCRGEPYALQPNGRLENVAGLDAAGVTARWREVLGTAPVDVFAVGGGDALASMLSAALGELPEATAVLPVTRPGVPRARPIQVFDIQPVEQGHLCLGYRTEVTRADPRYPAMLMYSAILGGFPHSKLFRNVREAASLAYSASSRWDSLKGLLLVEAGIEAQRFADAVEIIRRQVDDMADGKIDADEIEFTRRGLIHHLRAQLDSPDLLLDAAVGQSLVGPLRPMAQRIAEIEAVTVQDVVAVAEQVRADTLYFLADRRPPAEVAWS